MKNKKGTYLYCFSPLVMLITFVIEMVLCFYAIFRWGKGKVGVLAVFLLFFLGTFQWTEYIICKGGDPVLWAKMGHIAITWLPAIGFNVACIFTRRMRAVWIPWIIAVLLMPIIIFAPAAVSGAMCTGKYIVYSTENWFDWIYGVYYLGTLFASVCFLIEGLVHKRNDRTLLGWALFGFLSFLVPTSVLSVWAIQSRDGVPSVMCGFAILMALAVVFCVLPRYYALDQGSTKE